MQEKNLILIIEAAYNQFTKAEKKVADYVLAHQKEVLYMSITDLADACKVGDTSVYRFCRTMNLEGYQEFKMKLSMSQNYLVGYAVGGNSKADSLKEMAETIMNVHTTAIQQTFMLLDRKEFEKSMEMFEQAERVFFFGIGDSLLTAQEACNKFLRITPKTLCITDSHMQAMAASTASERDLIIIISYSGATKDNIHVAKIGKASGAKIVCISHYLKSPLTVYSDAVLLCGANEGPLEGGSMSVKLSQLYLIDMLYQEFYRRNYQECKKNNEKTSTAVVEKLY